MNRLFKQQIADLLSPYSTDTEVLEEIVSGIAEHMDQMPCKPAGNIAGPVMQQYIWSEPLMRKRFRKILAASMNPSLCQMVHPAFVLIAAQMSDTDWDFMRMLRENVTIGVANCYLFREERDGENAEFPEMKESSIKILNRMTEFLPEDGDYTSVQMTMDNLLRLQLIEVHMRSERKTLEDSACDAYRNIYMMHERLINQTVEEFRERFPKYTGEQIRLSTGDVTMTAFATRFVRICMV